MVCNTFCRQQESSRAKSTTKYRETGLTEGQLSCSCPYFLKGGFHHGNHTHDGFLHPGRGIAFGKILPQGVGGKRHLVQIAFLFLAHNRPHYIYGQMPLLTEFLEPLGLGKGGGGLFAVHRVQKLCLFFFFEKGQLIGRVQGNFLFVHHVQQFGD